MMTFSTGNGNSIPDKAISSGPGGPKGWVGGRGMPPQGEVTVNLKINRRSLAERQRNVNQLPKNEVMGTVVACEQTADIMPDELLFMRRGTPFASALNQFTGGNSNAVFSSFNGMQTNGATQQEFEDAHKFVGFSKIPYYYDPAVPGQNGNISVRTGGSGTTMNRGFHTFYPGSGIAYRLPSVDPAQCEEEIRKLPKFTGVPQNKLLAILYPYDGTAARQYLKDAADQLIMDSDDALRFDYLLGGNISNNASQHSPTGQLALALGRSDLTGLLSGIATLAEFGAITINLPSEDPLAPDSYSKFFEVFDQKLYVANKSELQIIRNKDNSDVVDSMQFTGDGRDLTRFSDSIKYLAGLLGLVDVNSPDTLHIRPNNNLQTLVLARMNVSVLPDEESASVFSLAQLFPENEQPRKQVNGVVMYKKNTLAGQICEHEATHKSTLSDFLQHNYDRGNMHCIGTALNTSIAGGVLDYILH